MLDVFSAAKKGNLDVVKWHINRGLSINMTDRCGRTLIHKAASRGQLKVTEYLVGIGADVNSTDKSSATPLHSAASKGQLKVVKYLVANGANFKLTDNLERSPLHLAAWGGHLKVVAYLAAIGAHTDLNDVDGLTPLHYASICGSVDVVEYLVRKGADIRSINTYGKRPLHMAVWEGHLRVIEYLVANGAYVNSTDSYERTPLHSAATAGQLKVVEYLVANGANINATDTMGETPVHSTASKGQLEILEYLVANGANINSITFRKETPLHSAATAGQLKVVEYLFAKGSNINSTDEFGQTPLHSAVSGGHLKVVEYLVGKGADTEVIDRRGRMPLYLAAQWRKLDVVMYLVSCHVSRICQYSPTVISTLNETALHHDSVKQAFDVQGCWDESKNAISVRIPASNENTQVQPLRASSLHAHNRSSTASSPNLQISHSSNENDIVKFIIMGSHPFTVSEQPESRNLILSYDPEATLVCSSTVGRRIIKTYEAKKSELIQFLAQDAGRVSFTTDFWTAPSQKVKIGVIASFITNNWESKTIGIAFRNLKGDCSSASISQQLQGILKEYGLDTKTLAMSMNTALKNNQFAAASEKTIGNGDGLSLSEFHGHSLTNAINLAVHEGLKNFKSTTEKLEKSMSALSSSAQELDTFAEFQSLNLLRAKLRTNNFESHWTALLEMFEVAVEMRGVIFATTYRLSELKDSVVSEEDWEMLIQVVRFFKPLCDIYDKVKACEGTTLYLIIPEYNRLISYCGRVVRRTRHPQLILDAAKTIRDCLISHYDRVYLICTVLDPRGKMSYFEGKDWVDIRESKVLPAIKDAWHRYKPATSDAMEQASVVSTSSTISSFCHLSTIDTHSSSKSDDMGSLSCENYDSDEEEDDDVLSRIKKRIRARDELDEYLARGPEVDEDDVLDFWKRHEEVWPNLSRMAKDYLAVPASNASSEREFSAGKILIQDTRNRLKPSGIEASVCLKSWWTADVVSSDSIVSEVSDSDDDGMLKDGENFDVEDEY